MIQVELEKGVSCVQLGMDVLHIIPQGSVWGNAPLFKVLWS